MIDSIEGKLSCNLTLNDLKKRARMLGLPYSQMKIRQNSGYVRFGMPPNGVIICSNYYSGCIYKLFLKPSEFYSYKEFHLFLELLLEPKFVDMLNIKRLDIAVDIAVPFDDAFIGSNVMYKRFLRVELEGKNRTGAYFGKGDHIFAIYDKARQKKLNGTLTRIESRLKGSALPAKKLYFLAELLYSKSFDKVLATFKKISINRIEILPYSHLSPIQMEKAINLKYMMGSYGFQEARKKLNESGNFSRKFKKYFQSKPLANVQELAWESMESFCSSWCIQSPMILRPAAFY